MISTFKKITLPKVIVLEWGMPPQNQRQLLLPGDSVRPAELRRVCSCCKWHLKLRLLGFWQASALLYILAMAMAQWLKMLPIKPNDPVIPGAGMVGRENGRLWSVLWPLHAHCRVFAHIYQISAKQKEFFTFLWGIKAYNFLGHLKLGTFSGLPGMLIAIVDCFALQWDLFDTRKWARSY